MSVKLMKATTDKARDINLPVPLSCSDASRLESIRYVRVTPAEIFGSPNAFVKDRHEGILSVLFLHFTIISLKNSRGVQMPSLHLPADLVKFNLICNARSHETCLGGHTVHADRGTILKSGANL